jgi:hypothetical protein
LNIIRFEMNVPTQVTLQSSQGVSVEGRYGTRMMFTLADGRVMYVPPIVAGKIEASGIIAGERFQLCKSAVKTGQRRSVEWLLQRTNSEQPEAESIPTGAETQLERDLRLSVEMAKADKTGVEPQPAKCTYIDEVPTFAQNNNGHSAGNGNGSTPANGPSAPITKLEHALKTAISAAYNAEKFGSELGYVVRFDSDAIKSMAITVMINMSERASR